MNSSTRAIERSALFAYFNRWDLFPADYGDYPSRTALFEFWRCAMKQGAVLDYKIKRHLRIINVPATVIVPLLFSLREKRLKLARLHDVNAKQLDVSIHCKNPIDPAVF